jgi:hypothetical protein
LKINQGHLDAAIVLVLVRAPSYSHKPAVAYCLLSSAGHKLLVKANRCSVLKSIQTFQKNIEDKPIHVCTVCIRTFFRNQVKKCNRQKYFVKEVISENAKKCITGQFLKTTDDRQLDVKFLKDPQFTEWICSTCDQHLKANNMPLQAYVNNLELLSVSLLLPSSLSSFTPFSFGLLIKSVFSHDVCSFTSEYLP